MCIRTMNNTFSRIFCPLSLLCLFRSIKTVPVADIYQTDQLHLLTLGYNDDLRQTQLDDSVGEGIDGSAVLEGV